MAASSSASDVSAAIEPKMVAERVRATHDHDDDMELEDSTGIAKKWQGTAADRRDMRELGRSQELRRNFQFLSILGFGCTLIATWEVLVTTLITSLTDGGTAGLLWGFIIVVIGFFFVYLSIAEMASMAVSAQIQSLHTGQADTSASQPQVVSTTGCRSSLLHLPKSS